MPLLNIMKKEAPWKYPNEATGNQIQQAAKRVRPDERAIKRKYFSKMCDGRG